MARSASLFGLLGLLFLAFGFAGAALVGVGDAYVLLNLVAGGTLVLAYLALGFEDFRNLLGQRSTRYGAGRPAVPDGLSLGCCPFASGPAAAELGRRLPV